MPRALAFPRVAILIALLSTQTACDVDVLDNDMFLHWCGAELCDWTIEAGEIRRVSTWHRSAWGAELVGDPVAISQLSEIGNGIAFQVGVDCIHFSVLGDIEPSATVTLEIDYLDDGFVDDVQPLVDRDYGGAELYVSTPLWFDSARFRVVKTGSGRAVLAQLTGKGGAMTEECPPTPVLTNRPNGALCSDGGDGVCSSGRCAPAPTSPSVESTCGDCIDDEDCPALSMCGTASGWHSREYRTCISVVPQENGAACTSGRQCVSGACCWTPVSLSPFEMRDECAACCDDSQCEPDQACGLEITVTGTAEPADPTLACGVPGRHSLGEWCQNDRECSTGHCVFGFCTDCFACAAGAECAAVPLVPDGSVAIFECAPGSGTRLSGEICLNSSDCASGVCTGAGRLGYCSQDWRPCEENTDCPSFGAEPAVCFVAGIAHGTCQ